MGALGTNGLKLAVLLILKVNQSVMDRLEKI